MGRGGRGIRKLFKSFEFIDSNVEPVDRFLISSILEFK
jgi:hypothetical protein